MLIACYFECRCDCLLCKLGTHCPICWLDQTGARKAEVLDGGGG